MNSLYDSLQIFLVTLRCLPIQLICVCVVMNKFGPANVKKTGGGKPLKYRNFEKKLWDEFFKGTAKGEGIKGSKESSGMLCLPVNYSGRYLKKEIFRTHKKKESLC